MTAMKPVLEGILDANIVLVAAFAVWALVQAVLVRSKLKTDYALQLRLLRMSLLLVALSPLLSFALVELGRHFWPSVPVTARDLAVASYLRGEIAMPAVQFETLLNTRSRGLDLVLSGQVPWATAALLAVVAGGLWLLARTLVSVFHIRRIVSQSFVWRRSRSTDIRLSDTATIPFATRGLWRRHIVLPSAMLTRPDQLRIVLAHEFEHLRQGDVEWELLFEMLRPVLYWNPVFILWKRAFGRLRELNCDRRVLDRKRISPRDYARVLLDFCGRQAEPRALGVMTVAFVRLRSRAARQALETRVLALQEAGPAMRPAFLLWLLAPLLGLAIALVASSVRTPGDWSQDRLMLSTIVNLERLEAINGNR